eukprot:CAMPEP_0174928322 /NCGR_PEP_ID=MMETSP1355-20121228/22855_1 /TAXON_ID=464990 /ORGANISM="Hemiselmis tepida, Strain CCMP443" /LENGTH=209 /DNA_ID=CAMNT_0016174479 /DNA_START=20 /DNA_END=650 /DNA_ORIENTATION=+
MPEEMTALNTGVGKADGHKENDAPRPSHCSATSFVQNRRFSGMPGTWDGIMKNDFNSPASSDDDVCAVGNGEHDTVDLSVLGLENHGKRAAGGGRQEEPWASEQGADIRPVLRDSWGREGRASSVWVQGGGSRRARSMERPSIWNRAVLAEAGFYALAAVVIWCSRDLIFGWTALTPESPSGPSSARPVFCVGGVQAARAIECVEPAVP